MSATEEDDEEGSELKVIIVIKMALRDLMTLVRKFRAIVYLKHSQSVQKHVTLYKTVKISADLQL
jgi:hypothetical protein